VLAEAMVTEALMGTSQKQVTELAGQSAFVFVGKVVKAKAATMADLVAPNTAIVQVEHVLNAPDMFATIGGQQVTIRMHTKTALKRGERRTFFANGWVFGASLAVDVIGTVDETDPDAMKPMLRSAKHDTEDDVLRARVQSAVMGVVGTVTSVARSNLDPGPISEHNPDWHEATIRVDEVIKGQAGVKQATVLFPNSDDARWHTVGKYTAGQQGIFMLQRGHQQDTAGIAPKLLAAVPAAPEVLTTLHPDDYQPLSELERVRALAHN
jgi:hypothetical protein